MPIFVIFYILFTQYYTSNNTQTPTFASKYKSIIMSTFQNTAGRMTNYRWIICAMLFFATTVNYLDRQVLSLTWKDFISPEFHWTDTHYGYITAIFSIVYALGNLFAGRFIDWMGTKKGYLWAIAVWSIGACMHALCGLATEMTLGIENAANMISATGALASTIAITSVYYFIAARIILGIGEAGNFPAAIKVTAEYFPKKDRAFSTSIFNAGSTIGALIAPLCIPTLARYFQRMGVGNGWEMAFIVIGGLGFIWMGLWIFMYKKPDENPHVNAAELAYIEQDKDNEKDKKATTPTTKDEKSISFLQCFKYPQTWAVFFGKFMTDGVWWFFLFWAPAYISDVYGFSSDTPTAQMLIFVLYAITMLSVYGGKLPTIIIIIGIAGAAHQSWSANIYSVVGDMFPKSTIATIVGIGGMAGGISSFLINMSSGLLFDYADKTQMVFLGFQGKPAGYFIIFCVCAVSYLIGWCIMKALVPKYKPIIVD